MNDTGERNKSNKKQPKASRKKTKGVQGGLESFNKDKDSQLKRSSNKEDKGGGAGSYIKELIDSNGSQGSKTSIENKFLNPDATQFKPSSPSSFHKGGIVKKGGVARVLKGEEVLTPQEAKKYHKMKKVSSPDGVKGSFGKSSKNKRSSGIKKLQSKKG